MSGWALIKRQNWITARWNDYNDRKGCVAFTFEFYGVHRAKSEVNRRCTTVQNSDDQAIPLRWARTPTYKHLSELRVVQRIPRWNIRQTAPSTASKASTASVVAAAHQQFHHIRSISVSEASLDQQHQCISIINCISSINSISASAASVHQ